MKQWKREEKLDPKNARTEKIARAKREKEIKNDLQALNDKRKQKKEGYVSGTDASSIDDVDEELLRKIYLKEIGITIIKAMENFEYNQQEIDMLEKVAKLKEQHGGKLPAPEPPKESTFKNFTLVSDQFMKKEMLKQGVFKPHWNLPTMTPEEWAEDQMKQGLLPGPNSNGNAPKKEEPKSLKEEEEEIDQKTEKDRKFDDFKDTHPTGWGNKNDNYFKRS